MLGLVEHVLDAAHELVGLAQFHWVLRLRVGDGLMKFSAAGGIRQSLVGVLRRDQHAFAPAVAEPVHDFHRAPVAGDLPPPDRTIVLIIESVKQEIATTRTLAMPSRGLSIAQGWLP